MDTINNIKSTLYLKKLLLITGVFFLLSCENDIERINLLTNPADLPDIQGKNMEIMYSDSGRIQMKLTAPLIKQYRKVEKPYLEFPEGIHILFYNENFDNSAELQADYAIYYNEEKHWQARGNVIAINYEKEEKLNTQELIWDEKTKKIYSNSFSRIENKDGTFYGQQGFEANKNLTNWKLKGSKGTLNIKDEPPNP